MKYFYEACDLRISIALTAGSHAHTHSDTHILCSVKHSQCPVFRPVHYSSLYFVCWFCLCQQHFSPRSRPTSVCVLVHVFFMYSCVFFTGFVCEYILLWLCVFVHRECVRESTYLHPLFVLVSVFGFCMSLYSISLSLHQVLHIKQNMFKPVWVVTRVWNPPVKIGPSLILQHAFEPLCHIKVIILEISIKKNMILILLINSLFFSNNIKIWIFCNQLLIQQYCFRWKAKHRVAFIVRNLQESHGVCHRSELSDGQ